MKKCKIDKLGRIVVPIQYRKELGLKENSELKIEYVDKKLIISPFQELCCICKEPIEFMEIPICKNCLELIKKSY